MHIHNLSSSGGPAELTPAGIDITATGMRQFDGVDYTDPELLFIVGLAANQRPWRAMLYHATKGPLFTTNRLTTLIGKFDMVFAKERYWLAQEDRQAWEAVLAADRKRRAQGDAGIKNLQYFREPPRMPACVGRALWSPRPRYDAAVWFFTHACQAVQVADKVLTFTTDWHGRQCRWLAWDDPGGRALPTQPLVDLLAQHAVHRTQWLAAKDPSFVVRRYHDHNLPAPAGLEQVIAYQHKPLDPAVVAADLYGAGQMILGRRDYPDAQRLWAQFNDYLTAKR